VGATTVQDALTWGALVLAGGSLVGVISFWMNLGKALAKGEAASTLAGAAIAKCEMLASQLADARVEDAREYATHNALAAVETRFVRAVDELKIEQRGTNERLDRIIENVDEGAAYAASLKFLRRPDRRRQVRSLPEVLHLLRLGVSSLDLAPLAARLAALFLLCPICARIGAGSGIVRH
jgi:hypothetical protein